MWNEKWERRTSGCSITVSRNVALNLGIVIREVTELMGWSF